MDPITQQTTLAAAGAGGDKVYVDDVFSTFLYTGNGGTQSINNGIDLAGEGGLVWTKEKAGARYHHLFDTAQGVGEYLNTNTTNAASTSSTSLTSFNSNGFTLGSNSGMNANGESFVSWSFRKAPGFFDVVTYTGNGTAGRTISHSLGSVPGMIIVKRTDSSNDWAVYHRSTFAYQFLKLNSGAGGAISEHYWYDTNPTSSVFTVGAGGKVNASGGSYVAYIFAHDDPVFGTDGDESIIKCGSFTGGGYLSSPKFVDVGFEAQYVLWKRSDSTDHWYIHDSMRGMANSGSNQPQLYANISNSEESSYGFWAYSNGFAFSEDLSGTSANYIYMAIRRPNKPPTAATEVFNPILADTPRTAAQRPEKVDMYWFGKTGGWGENIQVSDRLRGFQNTNSGGDDSHTSPWLITNDVNQEAASGGAIAQENNYAGGPYVIGVSSGSNFINYIFKRAPGFFDIVAYTANNNTAFNVNHNLGVAPELIIIKDRDATRDWLVGSDALTAWGNYGLKLNTSDGENTSSNYFTAAPTSTQFKLGTSSNGNYGTNKFIAYLFATLPGISKVGSYSGNTGNAVNVDCGFTNGARFVMIKRTDSTGDWYVWDTARGIVSGDDPLFVLNSTAAQHTDLDFIDPLTSGFTVTSSAPAALNTTGGTYLFLAIA